MFTDEIPHRVGLNLGHNGAIFLISQNGHQTRLEEEKVIQQKGYYGFPREAAMLVREELKSASSLKLFVGGTQVQEYFPSHRLLRKFFGGSSFFDYHYLIFDFVKFLFPHTKVLHRTLRVHLTRKLNHFFGKPSEVTFVDHHTAHAYSAVLDSGFDKAIVFTQDGKGDSSSGKAFLWKNSNLIEIFAQSSRESLGLIYGAVTKAIGFKQLRHEGKITGLAAFGKVDAGLLEAIAKTRNDLLGREKLNKDNKDPLKMGLKVWIERRILESEHLFYGDMFNFWVTFFRSRLMSISREDVAATVQFFVEQETLRTLKNIHLQNPDFTKVALAGGLFANVKLNQRIWDSEMFSALFVAPAMDDAGIALGSIGVDREVVQVKPTLNEIIFRGTTDCRLDNVSDISQFSFESDEELADFIAESILQDKVVGTYFGNLEWGPRSLGNRSILANAFNPEITKLLNLRLNRNDFMPFAPMILEEDMETLFPRWSTDLIAAKFMTVTLDVNKGLSGSIPSVVHVDGTARPQIINAESPKVIRLALMRIKAERGLGVCINTSFNLHESPILFSIKTAIENLRLGAVDFVIGENLMCFKKHTLELD